MAKTVISNQNERVAAFIAQANGIRQMPPCTTLGLLEEDTLLAGVAYTDYTKCNLFLHVAAVPGARWMTRRFLHVVFHYPFVFLGCNRITASVEESNERARKFDEHLGFTLEAKLQGAARDGGDIFLYKMTKYDCRFLGDKYAL